MCNRDAILRMMEVAGSGFSAVLDWRTNARETAVRSGLATGVEGVGRGEEVTRVARAHGRAGERTGWMGAGTVFKRKEKERG